MIDFCIGLFLGASLGGLGVAIIASRYRARECQECKEAAALDEYPASQKHVDIHIPAI